MQQDGDWFSFVFLRSVSEVLSKSVVNTKVTKMKEAPKKLGEHVEYMDSKLYKLFQVKLHKFRIDQSSFNFLPVLIQLCWTWSPSLFPVAAKALLIPWDFPGVFLRLKPVPSGKHTKSYWKWPFIVDFPIKQWWCSIAMLNYQRVLRAWVRSHAEIPQSQIDKYWIWSCINNGILLSFCSQFLTWGPCYNNCVILTDTYSVWLGLIKTHAHKRLPCVWLSKLVSETSLNLFGLNHPT